MAAEFQALPVLELWPVARLICGLLLVQLIFNWLKPTATPHTYRGRVVPSRFLHNAKDMLHEGVQKYKGGVFKVALTDRWLVVVTGRKLVDELQRLPDDTVSLAAAAFDFMGFRYMFGDCISDDPFHLEIIRSQLTRNLGLVFPDVLDEIQVAFAEDCFPPNTMWLPVSAATVFPQVIARASNRVFIGLPTCRDQSFLKLLVKSTLDVGNGRKILAMLPSFLKTIAGRRIGGVERHVQEGLKYLGPIIRERMSSKEKLGDDWADKPNDMLQWVIDGAQARNQGPEDVMRMVLLINFAAIHTSSVTFLFALYHLASRPEYITPLREEIESAIAVDGWTKNAVGKLFKLDSFLRESSRHNGINVASALRKAVAPLTLSDGTFIPPGTVLVAPAMATHLDEDNYESALDFDPFRYVKQQVEGTGGGLQQFVSTSSAYVAFGLGRHACPGRFFAASEIKAMMAYLIANYDVKMEQEGVLPQKQFKSLTVAPDPSVAVMFRRRQLEPASA